ncbi:autophagy-related protein 27 [Durotheca rogersii]|uniref:autophagy-related protein 27 n=1 Tax=Durotheca rogersii TaxID=419775 RepID=UPI00222068BA|nr:autophagy-related protein 27 [Durotheca rogersii]KAI5860351.1 autophagy-related protein 27 [Durotheca rogersii]
MRFPTMHAVDTALLIPLLLAPLPVAAQFQCEHIVVDKQAFDLSKLGGPHSVVVTSHIPGGSPHNTTYTVDICGVLRKSGDKKEEKCPDNSRACAIQRINGVFNKAVPLAGELSDLKGGPLDAQVTRLPTSDSNTDAQKHGLLLVLNGGFSWSENGDKRNQRVAIELVCDENRDGTEAEYDPAEDKYERGDNPPSRRDATTNPLLYRADGDDDKGGDGGAPKDVQLGIDSKPSLIFNSYAPLEKNSDTDVLRLTWLSKYTCDKRAEEGGGGPDAHWGFFTWLVILIFLGTAAYLIFGSWLNYNRYGARGWDLLPHGDTIRDIPYLLKDWTRRVLNTVQGSGSRGGYSAV